MKTVRIVYCSLTMYLLKYCRCIWWEYKTTKHQYISKLQHRAQIIQKVWNSQSTCRDVFGGRQNTNEGRNVQAVFNGDPCRL